MRIDENVMIERPVEEVWRFMADLSNYPKMNPGIHEMMKTTDGPVGVGTVFKVRLRGRGADVQVMEFDPPRRLTLQHASGPTKGTTTLFSMEAIEGKTRLTCTSDLRLSGFYRIVGLLFGGRARREVTDELGTVKRLVESEAQ